MALAAVAVVLLAGARAFELVRKFDIVMKDVLSTKLLPKALELVVAAIPRTAEPVPDSLAMQLTDDKNFASRWVILSWLRAAVRAAPAVAATALELLEVQLTDEEDHSTRRAIVETLGAIVGDAPALAATVMGFLEDRFNDKKDARVRAEVAEWFGTAVSMALIGVERLIALLGGKLSDSSNVVFFLCISSLSYVASEEPRLAARVVDLLEAQLEQDDRDPVLVLDAIGTAVNRAPTEAKRAMGLLEKHLYSDNWLSCSASVGSLGKVAVVAPELADRVVRQLAGRLKVRDEIMLIVSALWSLSTVAAAAPAPVVSRVLEIFEEEFVLGDEPYEVVRALERVGLTRPEFAEQVAELAADWLSTELTTNRGSVVHNILRMLIKVGRATPAIAERVVGLTARYLERASSPDYGTVIWGLGSVVAVAPVDVSEAAVHLLASKFDESASQYVFEEFSDSTRFRRLPSGFAAAHIDSLSQCGVASWEQVTPFRFAGFYRIGASRAAFFAGLRQMKQTSTKLPLPGLPPPEESGNFSPWQMA